MGGDIWVESEADVGSTFYFTVVFKKQNNQQLQQDLSSEEHELDVAISNLQGAKILIVEDNEINQELARELLVMNGLTVQTACNGKEALELLSEQNYDGILMDCQMPIMDGYEATRIIREQEKFNNLAIIAMTANVMKQDVEKVLSAGMNDHIAKPVRPNVMLLTMAKWIKPQQKMQS